MSPSGSTGARKRRRTEYTSPTRSMPSSAATRCSTGASLTSSVREKSRSRRRSSRASAPHLEAMKNECI
uniref:Uncharacterized protein n=1 Tax=Siphoviridae sp. ctrCv3 TaxID=2827954 RepID=A0A8S5SCN8_9CAUD|nr:MAG TPA: hypothetical protein [Siphoviridae sp. ctrCv3]DAO44153.1 MAG TPA: hypothetical protein [Caudoviricetes sp.]